VHGLIVHTVGADIYVRVPLTSGPEGGGNTMKTIGLIVGVLSVLLGGLWLLQGLGIVRIRPILCFANCEPIQGPSSTWAIIGGFVLIAGVLAILYSRGRRTQR
jgi:hypothetical protein